MEMSIWSNGTFGAFHGRRAFNDVYELHHGVVLSVDRKHGLARRHGVKKRPAGGTLRLYETPINTQMKSIAYPDATRRWDI